jgi:hypothetical protein
MRNDPFIPKALREANWQLAVIQERIQHTTTSKRIHKKKGLFARLFGRVLEGRIL